jgi:hypothetical protein
MAQAMQKVKEHYRPYWRAMYGAHRRERIYLRKLMAYEAKRDAGKPLSAKEAFKAATRPVDRLDDLRKEHEQARRTLARQQRADAKAHSDPIMQRHKEQFAALRELQALERKAESAALDPKIRDITFYAAKESLQAEQDAGRDRPFKRAKTHEHQNLPTLEQRLNRLSEQAKANLAAERQNTARPFQRAPEPEVVQRPREAPSVAQAFTKAADRAPAAPLSRAEQIRRATENLPTMEQRLNRPSEQAEQAKAEKQPGPSAKSGGVTPIPRSEQIKRDMDEWKKRNPGRDHGRER